MARCSTVSAAVRYWIPISSSMARSTTSSQSGWRGHVPRLADLRAHGPDANAKSTNTPATIARSRRSYSGHGAAGSMLCSTTGRVATRAWRTSRSSRRAVTRCFRSVARGDRARAPLRRDALVRAGEALARVGEPAPGLMIILSGEVDVFQTHGGQRSLIVTHETGSFMGELAQLGGRPALVDAIAREPVDVIVIPPAQLRALLIAEAELGERIMRALILRRMGLLETGAGGPIMVGGPTTATCCGSRTSSPATVIRISGSIPRPIPAARFSSRNSASCPAKCRSSCVPTARFCAIPPRRSWRAASA